MNQPTRRTLASIGGAIMVSAGAIGALVFLAGCGFVPPPEFNEVSDIDEIVLPESMGAPSADAGVTDASAAQPETATAGNLQLGVGMTTIPAMPISDLLGKARDDIETLLAPVKPEDRDQRKARKLEEKEGWIHYTEHLKVRFSDDDIAVELVQQVPADLTCLDAAKWRGFNDAMPPKKNKDNCEWPQKSDKHLLGPDVHGKLTLDGAIFHAFKTIVPVVEKSE